MYAEGVGVEPMHLAIAATADRGDDRHKHGDDQAIDRHQPPSSDKPDAAEYLGGTIRIFTEVKECLPLRRGCELANG